MKITTYLLIVATILLASCHQEPDAPHQDPNFALPALISDGMVLQRDTELNIWGYATQGSQIQVTLNGTSNTSITDSLGKWKVTLPKQSAGGPYNLIINYNRKHKIDSLWYNYADTIADVMIGEVWLCSGQDNMELPIKRVSWKYPNEVENPTNNRLRYFNVNKQPFFKHALDTLIGKPQWQKASPESVTEFSAIAYFFAKDLIEKLDVTIGVIVSAVDGSPAEAWISENSLKEFKPYYNQLQRCKDDNYITTTQHADSIAQQEYQNYYQTNDLGIKENWHNSDTDLKKWKTINIPCQISNTNIKFESGVVWFKRKINLTAQQASTQAMLVMGTIVDADQIYINGTQIGSTNNQYLPRRYPIPQGILKPGENSIAIRLVSNHANGGFVAGKDYIIDFSGDTLDISGKWYYQLGAQGKPPKPTTCFQHQPAGLYNAMIAPLTNYNIKGVIWYQGESNVDRYEEYYFLLQTLITNWRKSFNNDFPVLIVQLPLFLPQDENPSDGFWANMRDIQKRVADDTPNTYCVCTIDLGQFNDIHPLSKQSVAQRISLMAQKQVYGKNVVAQGPIIDNVSIMGNTISLSFTNIGSGLVSTDGKPIRGFAISGDDAKFYWADAVISGNQIKVSSKKVKRPVAIRYAWADNPGKLNLYNKEGLPALPFSLIE